MARSNDGRHLFSNNTKVVTKYVQELYSKLNGQKMFVKMKGLLNSSSPNHEMMEEINQLTTWIVLKVKKIKKESSRITS